MSDAFIVAGCRTPIGRFLGALSRVPAPALGAIAVREAVRRAGVGPEEVGEVILGNILSAGLGQAPARQAAIGAGIPPAAAAVTVNKMCGSGLKAVMLTAQAVRCGDAEVVVAGGMESMSGAPYLLPRVRGGWKYGHRQALDSMIQDGLWCSFDDKAMGAQADYIAARHGVSRADQDGFALQSHRRAVAARDAGAFDEELIGVETKSGAEPLRADEGPRADTTSEQLAALQPAFADDGTVTAGNASMLSDGAAAVVVTTAERAARMDTPVRARIVAYATSGVQPREIFIAPVSAVEQVLAKAGLRKDDIDLFEMNEAFAAQMLACSRALELDGEKVNVHGGAIALGHPIGASGARVLVTLLYALKQRDLRRGLVCLCLGGGNAVAMIVERE